MNNEKLNQIIDKAYENYRDKSKLSQIPTDLTKEEFVKLCKNDITFSVYWGLKIKERELSLEERYNIWFTNNYETGMERYFDPNRLPDFDNAYYEPTPTKLITVTYNNQTIEVY